MQTLEVGRCLPSGRGVNRASKHYDKHGCVAGAVYHRAWLSRLVVVR